MLAREPILDRTLMVRTVAPSALISTADAKEHCRINSSADDGYVDALVATATARLEGLEGLTGRAFLTQTWALSVRCPGENDRIHIPLTPVQSISTITYYDGAGQSQTATLSDYHFVNGGDWAYLYPKAGFAWPITEDRADAITITFIAGYGDADAVPANIVHAAKLLVSHYYENREQTTDRRMIEIPEGIRALVDTHKTGWIGS